MIDITNNNSFQIIKNLISSIKFQKYTKKILLINKIDLKSENQISEKEINEFLQLNNSFSKIEISIKDSLNYNEFINELKENLQNDKSKIQTNLISILPKNIKVNFPNSTQINLILLGDSKVGKTSFINRYSKNSFALITLSTMGMDNIKQTIKIKNKIYKLIIWDTVGQERYRSLPKKYYQNVNGILLLFDISEKKSFENISHWIENINDNIKRRFTEESNNLIITLIGNKIDLERKVNSEEINKLIKELNIKYFEVSCKLNINVYDSITYNIIQCTNNLNNFDSNPMDCSQLENFNEDGNKKGGCCRKKKE